MAASDEKITVHAPTEESAHPIGCVLYVDEGCDQDLRRQLTLRKGRIVIGTSAGCDLQLNDPKLSRRHVELGITREGIAVRDLESTNGTLYLGNRIEKALLKPGARLRLGDTVVALLPITDESAIEPSDAQSYGDLLGSSLAMRRFYATLERLETIELPVLIHGETGTGKELVARSLCAHGSRSDQPLVVLDCGAIPKNLVESEVFGHVRGAFTGATTDRPGAFERSDGGTLFLDEIGELPLESQPLLLRALESGDVKRVGEGTYRRVDVRVIAATNRDLKVAVKEGTFREDLYYRLAVLTVEVPPLRDHLEDIPILCQHFSQELGKNASEMPDSVLDLMRRHDWPGNVRELRNATLRVLSLGTLRGELSGQGAAPPTAVDASVPFKQAKDQLLQDFEATYVRSILDSNDGNISQSARSAGLDRGYFKELMRKHRISVGQKDGT